MKNLLYILLFSILTIAITTCTQSEKSQVFSQHNLLSGTSIHFDGSSDDENMSYSLPLIDFDSNFNLENTVLNDAKVKLSKKGKNKSLQISLGNKEKRPSATFFLPEHIDLSKFVSIQMDITNLGSKSISVEAQCFSDKDQSLTYNDGAYFYYRSMVVLNPSETDVLMIVLSRWMDSIPDHIQRHFTGMFGLPGGFVRRKVNLDLSLINQVSIFKQKTDDEWNVSVNNIRAVGKYSLPDETMLTSKFFPFIDQFGQYIHSDWPNKVKNPDDIKKQKIEEEQDLANNPQPAGWNKYGGWANGPSLEATGHFRMEKYNGKWWFVDPEGKLFWSQGLNIVTLSQRTRIRDREKYFSFIPPNDDFYRSNLTIKYNDSPTMTDEATEQIHKRLRSWGMNTIAANSNTNLYRQPKTPYAIEIRSGLPSRLPDDFDATSFKESFERILQGRYNIELSANDPWCIGYFIDNEYSWPENNKKEIIYQYFKAVREVLNKFAPEKLYLGCRSNSPNFNRIAFEAAAEYCDVISINHYDYNLSTFKETEGLDKPLIVGEYHFGALDRGLPHAGLRSASNQKQRARIYQHFVNQALESDYIVGAHWFQYVDQLYTARSDGENYQIGFVDICDRPHQEMIDATRKISSYLYDYRLNGDRSFEY